MLKQLRWIGVVACLALVGCSGQEPRPSVAERQAIRHIVVVPAEFTPQLQFDTFAVGAGSGATNGVGAGALSALKGGVRGGVYAGFRTLNPIALIGGVVGGVVLMPVGAVAGSVRGAVIAVAPDTAREIEALQQQTLARLTVQRAVAEQALAGVTEAGYLATFAPSGTGPKATGDQPDYRPLAANADMVLETKVEKFGFVGDGRDPLIALFMTGSARLVRSETGTELARHPFKVTSEARKLAEWREENGQRLDAAYADIVGQTAESIVEENLLVLPVSSALGHVVPLAGPSLVSPGRTETSLLPVPDLDTPTPTLAWKPFALPANPASNPPAPMLPDLAQASPPRYELCLWSAPRPQGQFHGRCLYRRKDLTETSHRLETPLAPGARYGWTVRARFTLDGRSYLSGWSVLPYAFDLPDSAAATSE